MNTQPKRHKMRPMNNESQIVQLFFYKYPSENMPEEIFPILRKVMGALKQKQRSNLISPLFYLHKSRPKLSIYFSVDGLLYNTLECQYCVTKRLT